MQSYPRQYCGWGRECCRDILAEGTCTHTMCPLAKPCGVESRLMDSDRLEALEKYVVQLVGAFAHLQEENKDLQHRVGQLQQTANAQKQRLDRLQPERDELLQFRTMIQSLQRERELIRKKLEGMLVTLGQLESLAPTDGKAGV